MEKSLTDVFVSVNAVAMGVPYRVIKGQYLLRTLYFFHILFVGEGSCGAVGRGSKDNFQESLLSPMWVPGIELSSVGKYLDPMSHLTDPRGTFNFENCFKLCPCVSVHMLASAHEYRPPQRWHYQQL